MKVPKIRAYLLALGQNAIGWCVVSFNPLKYPLRPYRKDGIEKDPYYSISII